MYIAKGADLCVYLKMCTIVGATIGVRIHLSHKALGVLRNKYMVLTVCGGGGNVALCVLHMVNPHTVCVNTKSNNIHIHRASRGSHR